MRLSLFALALLAQTVSAAAAPIPYATAVQNLKTLLVEQYRIDPAQLRETDSLRRDWLMDISFPELLEQYSHRFQGPEPKRVLRLMKVTCNNDSLRCVAQSIAAASK
jgi:hypothetical protein